VIDVPEKVSAVGRERVRGQTALDREVVEVGLDGPGDGDQPPAPDVDDRAGAGTPSP
jgi:hypothetical protein